MPSERRRSDRVSSRTVGLAGFFAVAMGVTLALAGNTNAFGAGGNGFMPCLPGSHSISVHYTYDATPATPTEYGLNSYTLTGFDAACSGDTVILTISGNPDGNPAKPVTEVLGTYNTALDPCSHMAATPAVVITNGTIVIHACPTYGPTAGPANLHDATFLELEVDGQDISVAPEGPTVPTGPTGPTVPTAGNNPAGGPITSVLGETFTQRGSSSGNTGEATTVLATAERLPFTGSWAALTFWIGVLMFVAGLFFIIVARRLHRPQQPSA